MFRMSMQRDHQKKLRTFIEEKNDVQKKLFYYYCYQIYYLPDCVIIYHETHSFVH